MFWVACPKTVICFPTPHYTRVWNTWLRASFTNKLTGETEEGAVFRF